MKTYFIFLLACTSCCSSCSQNKPKPTVNNKANSADIKVGGRCEGCEAIYECPVPFESLNETDTLPDFNDPGPRIEISGTIYQADGKTPAKDVILYIYHTDQKGIYAKKNSSTGWEQRHGYIRGWIKTNENGFYSFYTLIPASYPNSKNPQHIHPTIKEPGKSEYWIEEFLFDSDPLLPEAEKTKAKPVGGDGVLKTTMQDGILKAKRDIILGLNVEDYPKQ